jgi:hypothetical protein
MGVPYAALASSRRTATVILAEVQQARCRIMCCHRARLRHENQRLVREIMSGKRRQFAHDGVGPYIVRRAPRRCSRVPMRFFGPVLCIAGVRRVASPPRAKVHSNARLRTRARAASATSSASNQPTKFPTVWALFQCCASIRASVSLASCAIHLSASPIAGVCGVTGG